MALALRKNIAIEKTIEFQEELKGLGEIFPDYALLAPVSGATEILVYLSTVSFLIYWYKKGKTISHKI
ncbi:MAG: hypothetical protein ACI9FB_002060 [Candidatus Azotimanducaceae bacterium]|jgi:hypothetical protein